MIRASYGRLSYCWKNVELICNFFENPSPPLYSAWGEVISNIVPNITEYEKKIKSFCSSIKADEIVLFEKITFLALASCRAEYVPKERQREVNEIMTNKLKSIHSSNLDNNVNRPSGRSRRGQNFTFKTAKYQLFFRQFTPNTYILVVFYMTDFRRKENWGKYLCQNPEMNDVNEESINSTLGTTGASLLNVNIKEDLEEEIETKADLQPEIKPQSQPTNFTKPKNTNKIPSPTFGQINPSPKIKELQSPPTKTDSPSNRLNPEDCQFKLIQIDDQDDKIERGQFEHSALVETCIKEFCEEMKLLDSGSVKQPSRYLPR